MPVPPSTDALPMRWALILLAALLAGSLTGALTVAQTASWPAALLAALASAGVTVTALHQVVGG